MKNIKKKEQPQTSLTDSFWELTTTNKESLDNGTPTLIPFSIPSLNKIISGLIPNETIIILGSTGTGKSKIVKKLALKDIKNYCEAKNIKLRVVFNALEETREKIVAGLVAKEIKEMYDIDVNYYTITNYKTDKSLDDDKMEMINTARLSVEAKYGEVLHIISESNPYAFYKYMRNLLHSLGKFYYVTRDKNNKILTKKQVKLGERYNHYEYDEKTLVISVTDTVDKIQSYSENLNGAVTRYNKYDAVGRLVHYYIGTLLGPVCKVMSFIVSQQSPDSEAIETTFSGQMLINKMKPSLSKIRTNRSIQETATLILSLWNPLKFGIFNYGSYRNLNKIKGGVIIMSVLKSREGVIEYPKNEIPLQTNFAIDEVEELPLASETEKLKKYYK